MQLLRVRFKTWSMFTILRVFRWLSLGLSTPALEPSGLYLSCIHRWGSEGNGLGRDSACVSSLPRYSPIDLPSWLTLSRPNAKKSVSDYAHGSWKHHLHIGLPWVPSPRPKWYKTPLKLFSKTSFTSLQFFRKWILTTSTDCYKLILYAMACY